ncbi:hypothetical protein SNE40_021013 [Patella caerulea]|uniref:Neurotrimin n=2 Tax=Patella caerulea TaxID=87958 RepID=A0AAN8G1E7_PATCE
MDLTVSFKTLLCILYCCSCFVTTLAQEFDSESQDLRVMRGHNVTINCRVRNLGAYNVFWLKDTTVLSLNHLIMTSNARFSIIGRYNLQIINLQDEDEGKYQCQISVSPAKVQFNYLMVTVPPAVKIVNKSRNVEVTLHDTVHLQCSATGRPQPNITWVRQDKKMPNGEDYAYGDKLTLTDLQYNHGGMYKCIASNDVGEDAEDFFRVKIYYPPIIHTAETVIITGPNEEISIPCVVSAQPAPKIEWRHNGTKVSLRNLPQNKELKVLEDGFKTDYSLYIKGVTDMDFGNYSCMAKNIKGKTVHNLVLTPLPSKVEIVSDIEGNYSSVYDLKWMVVSVVRPSNYRLLIRSIINETLTSEWNQTDIPAEPDTGSIHAQSYTIRDLQPETMYEVILQAHNSYGWGESSDLFMFETNKAGFTPPTPTVRNPHIHSRDDSNAAMKLTAAHSLFLLSFLLPLFLS